MENNRIELEEFVSHIKKSYGERVFLDAVEVLTSQEIIYEGQFPFLDDATMRERNFEVQMSIFEMYGYKWREETLPGMFNVPGEGWMNCFYKRDGRFSSIKDVENEVVQYFTKKINNV